MLNLIQQLVHSQLKTAKHLWIVERKKAKRQETLKFKIGAGKYKMSHYLKKSFDQSLFAIRPVAMFHEWCSLSHCPRELGGLDQEMANILPVNISLFKQQ